MPAFALRPRSARALRRRLPAVLDLDLDAAQRDAAARPAGVSQLVLGEAGHGKTTVAAHRLARLVRASPARLRAVYLVPNEGLRRWIERLLVRLGADVPVLTFDRWARRQALRAFADLPRRESSARPAVVSRFKRDPALSPELALRAREPIGVVDDDADSTARRPSALAGRSDLQHLFGDAARMRRVAHASEGRFGELAVDALREHTRMQFLARSEDEAAHVDADRKVALDGLSLDEGTRDADRATVDPEDYAVLFALDRLRALHAGASPTAPRAYDAIVVDEAQELAPLELALVGRSLASGGTLIVAGDADQHLDAGACFEGWEAAMRHLGCASYERVVLPVSHRCPPRVATWARALREGQTPATGLVPFLRFADEAALARAAAEEVARVHRLDPKASVAVLCRDPAAARRAHAWLRGVVPRRLVLDGSFRPLPGADVTTVSDVKGLEFDYVLVPDASASSYPDVAPARRALYVAATRARQSLVLACAGEPSPLACPARLPLRAATPRAPAPSSRTSRRSGRRSASR